MKSPYSAPDPHQGQPIITAGEPLERARAAMLLIHGRGATAEDILTLSEELPHNGFTFLAPQARGGSWYPNRFLDPVASNEPWLSSALAVVDRVLGSALAAGIPAERVMLLGFSQGACLALEFSARNPRRYGGIAGLSGGLIGADDDPFSYHGSLAGTPAFLGCSDPDPHIPKRRVLSAAEILGELGAQVTTRLYPNLGHTINQDEINAVRQIMAALTGAP